MRDNIPDALITAFERQYDSSWNDPQLRNERLAMRYGWAAAMEAKPCLHQIQEPTVNQQLTDAQIKEGRRAVNDDPDDQPEPWAFREGVKFAERMHGITKEKQA